MVKNILRSFLLLMIFTIILGFLYPLLITGISKIVFLYRSSGSLIKYDNKVVGSELIGQNFTGEQYFHSRPSAATKDDYYPLSSGGSNYASTNKDFISAVKERISNFRKENNLEDYIKIPSDIVTSSGSGLDPDISVDNALLQADRIAKKRNIPVSEVNDLIRQNIEKRMLGFLGEPKVNVLKLNLLLDNLY
ncbi:MAG: potassium-transporting ATPase subunit KdpC [Actinobacteria bacterium]|nr:potassium-transporting ATPase subunit KdpC [Actinomycetota bacterium]